MRVPLFGRRLTVCREGDIFLGNGQSLRSDRIGTEALSCGRRMCMATIPRRQLVEVLKRCGDDLTRENVMKQAASLNTTLPMLLPGVKLSMSPTGLRPMKQTWLQRFDGERWRLFGDVVDVTK